MFTPNIRNRLHGALGRSATQLLLTGMSSVIKDLYLHKKMVEPSRGLNSTSDDFMNSSFGTLVFGGSVEYLTTPIQQ